MGFVGITKQFVLTMELGTKFIGQFVACTVSYCKYPGMKLENWDDATCRTLAHVSTTLVYIKNSSH